MKKIEIEIPDGYKEVIKQTENSVVIEWVKENKEQEMRDFLKPFLTNLISVRFDKYPDNIFYKHQGEVIFQLQKYGSELYFWVDLHKIWDVIENKFGVTYEETQLFIKGEVEDEFNIRNTTVLRCGFNKLNKEIEDNAGGSNTSIQESTWCY